MQEYAMAYNGNSNQIGVVQDPLSSYGNTDKLQGGGRGQFGPGISITIISGNNSPGTGVAGSVTFNVTLQECLLHPFLKAFSPESTALVGVRQMDFNITFVQDVFKSLWAQSGYSAAGVITSYTNNPVPVAPSLGIITYDANWPIPKRVLYTFPKVVTQSQNVATLAPGASTTINYNSFQIGTELDAIILFARENDNNTSVTSTNTFAQINNINVTYNNVNNILSSFTPLQIWQNLHSANGGNMSFNEFNSFTGGVVKLIFTKDIPIDDGSAPGMSVNKNVQIVMQITNINTTRSISYTAWIIFQYKGVMDIDTVAGTMETRTTVLSAEDVFAAGDNISTAEITQRPTGWYGSGKAAEDDESPASKSHLDDIVSRRVTGGKMISKSLLASRSEKRY
jgi:hypothetical protein